MFHEHRVPLAFFALAALTQGCSGGTDGGPPDADWTEPTEVARAPSYEEYRDQALRDGEKLGGFVVEHDMLFSTEEQLLEYYEQLYVNPVDKSIINLAGGVRDRRSNPLNIRYCFAAGWGLNQGGYIAPALNPVRTAIQQAMEAWEGVGRVQFTYQDNLDGASCTTSGMNPGVDFVVQHYDDNGSGIAIGPFPSNTFANQQLLVPESGISRLLAIHEIGHSLGFRHEHTHSGASPRCAEGGTYEELTVFDTQSCMKYSNCTTGSSINGTEISMLDGVGAQTVYGPPDWWWPVLASPLLD
jgi:hypothetical protein